MLELGDEFNAVLWLAVTIVSLVPLTLFLISYIRVRSTKLLITTAAFALFTVKALILAMKLFLQDYDDEVWWSLAAVMDILIISLIGLALKGKASDS